MGDAEEWTVMNFSEQTPLQLCVYDEKRAQCAQPSLRGRPAASPQQHGVDGCPDCAAATQSLR